MGGCTWPVNGARIRGGSSSFPRLDLLPPWLVYAVLGILPVICRCRSLPDQFKALDEEFVRLRAYYNLQMTYIYPVRMRELGIPAC
jgi:hypothetical protein